MLHHIEIYVSDIRRSKEFWKNLLSRLGYIERSSWNDGFTLAQGDDAYITFVQVRKKHSLQKYHRCSVGLNHLAFKVDSHVCVDMIRNYCIENGIPCLYEDHYPFANGGKDYYALFVEDPDRIKVEFVSG
jgi:catechol 2,3-dioxygenase-like lactoylglutathione lyase family enzyme